MSDIVDRLRALSQHKHDDLSVGDEAADEIERLRAELAESQEKLEMLANETVYRGNSVAYIYQKMEAYRNTIDRLCNGMRKLGIPLDGKTSAVDLALDAIDKARAELAACKEDAERYEGAKQMTPEQTMLFKRLIEYAHRQAMMGNGQIAQDIRLALNDAARYWHLRDRSAPEDCKFFLATNEQR